MFQIVSPDTRIDFIGLFRFAGLASLVVILVGMASLVIQGPRYGIDFSGGTLVHVRFADRVSIEQIRGSLAGLASGDSTVQDFGGGSHEFLVRLPEADPELKKGLPAQVTSALRSTFGEERPFEILRVESVGPRIGDDLRNRALLAVVAATFMMALYIAFRFELRFGLGAALALVHDVLVTVGALSLAGIEFDLSIVAALLTVVGYSVNDTVIVSDRIRENLRRSRREPIGELLNRSINETLSRTIMTTGSSLLVILALFFLGGEVIHGFAFTLLVGLVAGTYSSIFISTPTVHYLQPADSGRRSTPRSAAA